jgi:hypothetical protein
VSCAYVDVFCLGVGVTASGSLSLLGLF